MMESKISHLVSGIYAFPHQDLVAGDGRKASAEVESNENEEYLECAKRFAETESETSDDVPEFVACEDYEEESDYSRFVFCYSHLYQLLVLFIFLTVFSFLPTPLAVE